MSDNMIDLLWLCYGVGIVVFACFMEEIVSWELEGKKSTPTFEVLFFIVVCIFWIPYLFLCLFRWCRNNWYSYG